MVPTQPPSAPAPDGFEALRYYADARLLRALDQTLLPHRTVELELRSAEEVAVAIERLAIRGAPMIGAAAAYGLALALAEDPTVERAHTAAERLKSARPTAVNLAYGVDRVLAAALAAPPGELAAASLAEADAVHADEVSASAAIATAGADLLGAPNWLLEPEPRIMTHCNAGALAVPGGGTAIAVLAELHRRGGLRSVIATESRPLLQGARLTVYELAQLGIPHELIVDAAAAWTIASGAVDAVIVGCDRVAANGDVANKIGTYGLALACAAAGVPFIVAGPTSTIDLDCPSGKAITIEERSADEVRHAGGRLLTLAHTPCRNPAFDVTPAAMVSALVTERGVVTPVNRETIAAVAKGPRGNRGATAASPGAFPRQPPPRDR
ncbi:MAG: S-methyl-5-thioribose-1-phosphate isomerase [Solirubrobacteraceae bacterium]